MSHYSELNLKKEYKLQRATNMTLHLARMPQNYKPSKKLLESKLTETKSLIFKKQKLNTDDGVKEYVIEEIVETPKDPKQGNKNEFTGRQVSQGQKSVVMYRKGESIVLCPLTSTIAFNLNQNLAASSIEKLKDRKRGRKPGISKFLKGEEKEEAKKEEEPDSEPGTPKSWEEEEIAEIAEQEEKKRDALLEADAKKNANMKDKEENISQQDQSGESAADTDSDFDD